MNTDTKLNTIEILEDRIAIHQEWADYFKKHYEKETDPEFKKLGNALFHRQCIKEYQFIISQFNKAMKESILLAKLAARTPQFDSPVRIVEANKIRDRILAQIKTS